MPELPEVETVRLGLESLIVGKTIKHVSYDTDKSFPNDNQSVQTFVLGAKVIDVRRRAKVLMIDLSTDYSLMIHLKMTGQLVFVDTKTSQIQNPKSKIRNKPQEKQSNKSDDFVLRASNLELLSDSGRWGAGHPNDSLVDNLPDRSTRVIFEFDSNKARKGSGLAASTRKTQGAQGAVHEVRRLSTEDSDKVIGQERWQHVGLTPTTGQCGPCLFFNDQRKFGWVKVLPTKLIDQEPFMQKVGPEPLDGETTAQVFIDRVRRRKKSLIKAAILDQTVIAGIGNIYADEGLWGAQVHPGHRVQYVSNDQLERLFSELVAVLTLSIQKGGSTNKNYVNAEGKRGSYMDFARVFRREGQPCPRCATTIEKIRAAGRGTHLCPTCQVFDKKKEVIG